MYLLLNILWFAWMLKYISFWTYLWQLKDYHIGRFLDHFKTAKGKKILFDPLRIIKAITLVLFLVFPLSFEIWFYIIFALYLLDFAVFMKSIFNKTLKRPVVTVKTILLGFISFLLVIFFLTWVNALSNNLQPIILIAGDILTPIIISIIILLLQPLSVIVRKNTLKRAKGKMEEIKRISNLKVIAITGSYGKTSTKEFLSSILSKKYKILKTKDHQNSEIGVANCILNDLNSSHEIFIVEIGAYNKGKVKEVCNIVKPNTGVVTGVNSQHLALFKTMENLLSAEGGGELKDLLPKNGTLIVNGDNKYCLDLYKKDPFDHPKNKKIYSLQNKEINADIWADDITIQKDFVSFVATDKTGEMTHFDVKVLGKHNVQNLLAAILTAKEAGMNFGEISEACKKISPEQAGMILSKGKYDINIIDSSYSANPDGVAADLEYLNNFEGKKVIVIPSLIELGKKSAELHKEIGKKIGEICDLAIITSKDKFNEIKSGAVKYGMLEKNIIFCDKSEDIHSIITVFCKAGDTVLLEGRVPTKIIELLK